MRQRFIGLLLCSTLALALHAQSPSALTEYDSLLRIYEDPSRSDSLRGEVLFMLNSAKAQAQNDSNWDPVAELRSFKNRTNSDAVRALYHRRVGYDFYGQRQYDSANFHIEAGKRLATQMKMWETLFKLSYTQIFVCHATGEKHEGIQCAQTAIEAARKAGNLKGEADALQQLGQLQSNIGEYNAALKTLQAALVVAEKLDVRTTEAFVLGTLGILHYKQGETEKAVEYAQKSLDLLIEAKIYAQVASGYGNLAMMYDHQGKAMDAYDANLMSIQYARMVGDSQSVAISLMNIGTGQGKRQEFDQAIRNITKAQKMLETYGTAWPINSSMKQLGIVYAQMNDHKKAVEWCLKAYDHSVELDLLSLQMKNLECVYQSYLELNDFKNAFEYYQRYKIIEDSLYSEDKAREFARQETTFRYEKEMFADSLRAAEEIHLREVRLEKEQTQRYALYGGIALLLLFGAGMYNRFRVTARQNQIISEQKKEVEHQHEQLEEKNREILDSIEYAKRIQTAILPPDRVVKEYLDQSFILYKPKDVVAGDFYWLESAGGWIFFAAADCTGHGVPGAMVSVICNNGLNRSVREFALREPGAILDKTRELVIKEFEKSEEEVKDGMDISLCALNPSSNELLWAGANNPLWIVRNGSESIEEVKPDKQPIGKYADSKPFTSHKLSLNLGDTIYLFSDGYPDQFGGEKGKKYKSVRFKETLIALSKEPMEKQRQLLDDEFENWRGDNEQIDDVCVIGVKIV